MIQKHTTNCIQARDAFVLLTGNMSAECHRFRLGFCLLLKATLGTVDPHNTTNFKQILNIICVGSDTIQYHLLMVVLFHIELILDIRAVRKYLQYTCDPELHLGG